MTIEVGQTVRVTNANHPYAGDLLVVEEVDGEEVTGKVSLANGAEATETFNVDELDEDTEAEVVQGGRAYSPVVEGEDAPTA